MLKKLERYIGLPYDDGSHIATIGVGIALQNKDRTAVLTGNLALVLRKIGVFSASDATAPVGETGAQKNLRYQTIINEFAQIIQSHSLNRITEPAGTSTSETALQNALNLKVAQYITTLPNPTFFLSEPQAKEVKREYILGYTIGPFSGAGAQAELDARLNGLLAPASQPVPHDTREYKALMSLYFNGPTLIGDKLHAALVVGDRAEAWFEIRYGSNAGSKAMGSGLVYCIKMLIENVGETFGVSRTFLASAGYRFGKQLIEAEQCRVTGREEHILAAITAHNDVVETAGNVKTGLAGHASILQRSGQYATYQA